MSAERKQSPIAQSGERFQNALRMIRKEIRAQNAAAKDSLKTAKEETKALWTEAKTAAAETEP